MVYQDLWMWQPAVYATQANVFLVVTKLFCTFGQCYKPQFDPQVTGTFTKVKVTNLDPQYYVILLFIALAPKFL